MNRSVNQRLMASLLDQAYLEVIPTRSIMDRLVHIPRHCFVAISCSPTHGVEPTLELVEKLSALPDEQQLRLIPHISARMIRDKSHLAKILQRLDAAKVDSIFVPGGVGRSLKLLKKQKGLLKKFISAKPYQPDDLLAGLQAQLHDPEFVISALHLFSFNDVERTENWRASTCERLKGEQHAG